MYSGSYDNVSTGLVSVGSNTTSIPDNVCIGSTLTGINNSYIIGSHAQDNDVIFSAGSSARMFFGVKDSVLDRDVPDNSIIIRTPKDAQVLINGIDITELASRVDTLEAALVETRDRLEAFMDMHLLLVRDIKAKSGEAVPVHVLGDTPTTMKIIP